MTTLGAEGSCTQVYVRNLAPRLLLWMDMRKAFEPSLEEGRATGNSDPWVWVLMDGHRQVRPTVYSFFHHPVPDTCVCSVTHSCLTLWDPMDSSPPGPSVHGISQTRIPEWVAISSSRVFSQCRDQTGTSGDSCIGGEILYHWATRQVLLMCNTH